MAEGPVLTRYRVRLVINQLGRLSERPHRHGVEKETSKAKGSPKVKTKAKAWS